MTIEPILFPMPSDLFKIKATKGSAVVRITLLTLAMASVCVGVAQANPGAMCMHRADCSEHEVCLADGDLSEHGHCARIRVLP
jgi:hypothetical protein